MNSHQAVKIEVFSRSKSNEEYYLDEWRDAWLGVIKAQPHNFFHSWPWTEHWLKKVPMDVDITLTKINSGNSTAICTLGHKREKRHIFIASNSYYLNYTGDKYYDTLTLEYNNILTENPTPDLLHVWLKSLPRNWDEIQLPALDNLSFPANCLEYLYPEYRLLIKRKQYSYFIDLALLDENVDTYLRLLSKETRKGIRQNIRNLSRYGQLRLIPAANLDAALEVYKEMVRLHQKSWEDRGMPGAFANQWFYTFHKEFIENRFNSGEVQLLRIACGDDTVGCLYNFVYQGTVLCYQSGLNYSKFRRYSPGLICDALAISHNASLGYKKYDFLAGNSESKRRLSTDSNEMMWCTIQRPLKRFKLESIARKIKSNLSNRVTS